MLIDCLMFYAICDRGGGAFASQVDGLVFDPSRDRPKSLKSGCEFYCAATQ